jgi:hypothetical protein
MRRSVCASLPAVIGRQEPQIVGERNLMPVEEERVIQREEDAARAQIPHHLERIAAQRLQIAVDRFARPVDAKVDLQIGVGHPAGDFLAGEEVGCVRIARQEFETAVDRIVIGDGDDVHAAALGDGVDVERVGIAVAAAQKRQRAVDARVARVDVKVGARWRLCFTHDAKTATWTRPGGRSFVSFVFVLLDFFFLRLVRGDAERA